ncbi:hypothetical protein G5I_05901 [Acromyrmex echinatior]|uniref:Uncharacterized protein n=1 Tax=Acromyrmex echinatior TaxID=103372 RepID=F4WJM0_ACREC|nr:hypothetical protein G5I_05901 [Acromyrmex echinatior]
MEDEMETSTRALLSGLTNRTYVIIWVCEYVGVYVAEGRSFGKDSEEIKKEGGSEYVLEKERMLTEICRNSKAVSIKLKEIVRRQNVAKKRKPFFGGKDSANEPYISLEIDQQFFDYVLFTYESSFTNHGQLNTHNVFKIATTHFNTKLSTFDKTLSQSLNHVANASWIQLLNSFLDNYFKDCKLKKYKLHFEISRKSDLGKCSPLHSLLQMTLILKEVKKINSIDLFITKFVRVACFNIRVGHLLLKVSASRMKNDFVHVAPSTGLTVCHSVTPIINDILDYLGANFTQNSRNIMSSTNIPFSRTFLTNLRIAPSGMKEDEITN